MKKFNIKEKMKNIKDYILELRKKLYEILDRKIQYKIAFKVLIVFICAFLALIAYKKSFSLIQSISVKYNERSNIDYKVYLKPNDFYETKYLGKDRVYIASLIDKIGINFNYSFDVDRISSVDFEYSIIAKISISDKTSSSVYYEKEYVLKDKQISKMDNLYNYNISDSVDVDYDYYNSLATKFSSLYGVNANSNLTVYMKINKKSAEGNSFNLSEGSNIALIIPLTERAININMNYKEINTIDKIINKESIILNKYHHFLLFILFIAIIIIEVIDLIKIFVALQSSKSKYDKYISKILREYDRLIVETTTRPEFLGSKVVTINEFNELLDVRDNLQLPIKYYNEKEHVKSVFYINNNNELYLYQVFSKSFEE